MKLIALLFAASFILASCQGFKGTVSLAYKDFTVTVDPGAETSK